MPGTYYSFNIEKFRIRSISTNMKINSQVSDLNAKKLSNPTLGLICTSARLCGGGGAVEIKHCNL